MRSQLPRLIAGCAGAALLLGTSCSKKTDAKSELDRAAAALNSADTSAPAPAPAAPTPPPAQAAPAAAPEKTEAPSVQMSQAMAAYKSGQLEDAVTRLHKLRATPALTPNQRIALNDAMAAVMTEIYEMAAKGDSRAIAAVKQSESLQSRPR